MIPYDYNKAKSMIQERKDELTKLYTDHIAEQDIDDPDYDRDKDYLRAELYGMLCGLESGLLIMEIAREENKTASKALQRYLERYTELGK